MSAAEQLGLLDHNGRVHAAAHDTEVEAAKSIDARVLRGRVLALLQAHTEGLTDDEGGELMRAQGLPLADRLTFGRRRSELFRAGLVRKSGVKRPTKFGRDAIVWVAS